ncbi:hypothetical protein UlMin_039213 [Ulmus minor]
MKPYTRLIFTTTIHLPKPHAQFTRRIELTPFDLQLLLHDQIQKGLLFHKPQNYDQSYFVEHLKRTLSRTLEIFYPLAGRLVKLQTDADDHTASFFIDCNDAGAIFSVAVANGVAVDDVLKPFYVPDDVVYSFFPMNDVLNFEGDSKPLLAVQVTELVDGIFIGCTMNHCVVDGSSFWQFFNTWSQISRCSNDLVSPQSFPVFSREYLNGIIDLPLQIPFSYNEVSDPFIPPPLKQSVFHFSKEKISQLKAKANSEMTNDMSSNTNISSLQALLAHLWISITRNRRLNADQEVIYFVAVGLRQRLQPPLPDHYLGNAVIYNPVKCTAGELLERGLGWAAWKINKMIASASGEEAKTYLKDRTKNTNMIVKRKRDSMLCNANLGTGSSPRFNVYGNDFGWGKPLAVRSGPGNKFDGKLTVFEGAEDGSIDFEASLSPETLKALASDDEFMEYI